MQPFLEQAANVLWQHHGEEISNLKLVFPSKRARLFFGEALSRLVSKPIWQPQYLSIDDLVWEMSGLEPTENLRLLAELYTVHNEYQPESFDKFYGWGTILLRDFDTIDKYMVDAKKLFSNISDLKDIETHFDSESPALEIVKEFWQSFADNKSLSAQQSDFLKTWGTLAEIYSKFKKRLYELGVAYPGMAYRAVANDIAKLSEKTAETYCFLGFNALNKCEQIVFKELKEQGRAIFLWDYSTLYLDDMSQEAGRFIRRNLTDFPQTYLLDNDYNKDVEISVISSPTDILQCKAIAKILEQIYARQGFIDKETAIVLTDENLLRPVLGSIPECVSRLNITMGYPLVNTVVYNLLERLLQLQLRAKNDSFYYQDVIGILSHPYVVEHNAQSANHFIMKIEAEQKIYISESELAIFCDLFKISHSVNELQAFLLKIISQLSATNDPERREYTYSMIASLNRLATTIKDCKIELTKSIYISLLRQILNQVRIPFTGEPLGGVQVLGILETRNVDFKNVIMLSVNDDNFPGNLSGQSYIPYNLRQAYGLPTVIDAEAMYAYYFYRLLQYSDTFTMLYTSAADDRSTGEQSRYIYQLEYESQFNVNRADISLEISQTPVAEITILKTPEMLRKLHKKNYSPSALNRYITCPLKFYFNDIENFRSPKTIDEEFSKMNLGNTLHKAMQMLYEPIKGVANPQTKIEKITDAEIESAIADAISELSPEIETQNSAQLKIGLGIAFNYIKQNLRYDSHRTENYIIEDIEVTDKIDIAGVTFKGVADRLDRLENGSITIIDYKTGSNKLQFKSIAELFDPLKTDRNEAALQLLIYALIFSNIKSVDVQPQLYISKYMNRQDYSSLLINSGEVIDYLKDDMREELNNKISELIAELLNPDIPFLQNKIGRNCELCDYNTICNK